MNKKTIGALALFSVLILAGCASSPPSKFYMLNPIAPKDATSQYKADLGGKMISIGPVTVPAYVNRPQMVERVSPEELRLLEFNRWAEPVDKAVILTLQDNLNELLGKKGYTFFKWNEFKQSNYQLIVQVTRLDGAPGGKFGLTARWSVLGGDNHKLLLFQGCRIIIDVPGSSPKDLVTAHSEALADLSRRIATSLQETLP
ncbi:PqiC family protein [Desulfoferula mesophila]